MIEIVALFVVGPTLAWLANRSSSTGVGAAEAPPPGAPPPPPVDASPAPLSAAAAILAPPSASPPAPPGAPPAVVPEPVPAPPLPPAAPAVPSAYPGGPPGLEESVAWIASLDPKAKPDAIRAKLRKLIQEGLLVAAVPGDYSYFTLWFKLKGGTPSVATQLSDDEARALLDADPAFSSQAFIAKGGKLWRLAAPIIAPPGAKP